MSNTNKTRTLGMAFGTANGRLYRLILFRVVQKASMDSCIRCGKKIESAAELSVEHIKPWENVSAELFWDLDNIGFSHLRCNVVYARRGRIVHNSKRRSAPLGTAWCSGHKSYIPIASFHLDRNKIGGVTDYCKGCTARRRL